VFEVVIASGDTEETTYQSSLQEMPWLSLGFRSKQIGSLMRQFGVRKSPFMAVIDRDGTLITKEGKAEFNERGLEALLDWTAGGEEEVEVGEDDYEQENFEEENVVEEYNELSSNDNKYDHDNRISINSKEPNLNFYQQPSPAFTSQKRSKGRRFKTSKIHRAGSLRPVHPNVSKHPRRCSVPQPSDRQHQPQRLLRLPRTTTSADALQLSHADGAQVQPALELDQGRVFCQPVRQ